MTDTFEQITAECDETPLLYATVLASLHQLSGTGYTTEQAGLHAWEQLTTDERRAALPALLECYTSRVAYEEVERAHQAVADNPDVDTCLDDGDEASAWDSVATHGGAAPDADETVVDRQVLTNLLSELDLLRRRSAGTQAPKSA